MNLLKCIRFERFVARRSLILRIPEKQNTFRVILANFGERDAEGERQCGSKTYEQSESGAKRMHAY